MRLAEKKITISGKLQENRKETKVKSERLRQWEEEVGCELERRG